MLHISSRADSSRTLWKPYDEQLYLWGLLEKHQYLLVAKPRKTGISLATLLSDYIWTVNADTSGNIVRCVFAIDTDDKAKEHSKRLEHFAKQIGRGKPSAHGLTLPGGSEIVCMTAGGKQPGRGGDIHRLHFTELPFCADPSSSYTALRSSCADQAQVIIETTMDSIDDFTASLWDGANEFHKHFWRVEDHASYRKPVIDEDGTPTQWALTDDEWAACEADGFTDIEAAAWWLKHALPNICAGKRLMLLHDFPQKESHLFAAGVGRVIDVTPAQPKVHGVLEVRGVKGDKWGLEIYKPPDVASGQYVVTVDTARGIEKSHSVVCVTDKRDREIVACFTDPTIRYDDLAHVAVGAREHYICRDKTPDLVVEDDGVGDATCERLEARGIDFERFSQGGDDNKERCITYAKRAIEEGCTLAPSRLQEECNKLHKDEKGKYKGPKDVVMSYGMALVFMETHAYEPEYAGPRIEGRTYYREALEEHVRSRAGGRPRFGI